MLDPGQRGEEEGRLLGLFLGLLRLVPLLNHFEVQERLPARAGEQGEGDELAVQLWGRRKHVRWRVLDRERLESVERYCILYVRRTRTGTG